MAEHRALRAARGSRGVENRRQIARAPIDHVCFDRRGIGGRSERPLALRVEREHRPHASQRLEPGECRELRRIAHEHRGGRVADEVLGLGRRIRWVERNEHRPRAHAPHVERKRGDAFLDLRHHPIAGRYPAGSHRRGHLRRVFVESPIPENVAGGRFDQGRRGRRARRAKTVEEVVGHRVLGFGSVRARRGAAAGRRAFSLGAREESTRAAGRAKDQRSQPISRAVAAPTTS